MKKLRLNQEITAPEVRLVGPDGTQIGIVSRNDALSQAEEAGLDLVEINPSATPPVCRLLDWGKYQYEQTKQREKSRARGRVADVKGIRLGLKTGPHDLEIKARRAAQFLERGHRVKVSLILRGRENARPELGQAVLNRFIASLSEVATPEGEATRQGREIARVLTPIRQHHAKDQDS